MNHRAIVIAAAKHAGNFLLKEFKRKHVAWRLKHRHEIVTGADIGAERIILSLLRKHTPNFEILSEESGLNNKRSDYLWVVDPLDGTTNFEVHNPLFSVSIALYYRGQPKLGVVYAPYLGDLFVAETGRGAYLNGKRIHVSKTSELKHSFLTYCYGQEHKHMRRAVELYRYFKMKSVDMRQLGSAAVELAWVAAGRTESIIIPGTKPWDAAAGVLLVTEAGGQVTDFKNKPWR
ncbi:MAG: inositol monophosphatase, partial [Candidatus Kerfeldbacteria bacterium]|nr:inositol monophosphatase [Candidatus Kerfeldbacteria bacterium]